MSQLPTLPVLVISDSRKAENRLGSIFEQCLRAGVRWFCLREPRWDRERRRKFLGWARPLMDEAGGILAVQDDVESAAALGLGGIHLRSGGDAGAARARLGHRALIGVNAHSIVEARAAFASGADYVTLGPAFPGKAERGTVDALSSARFARRTERASAAGQFQDVSGTLGARGLAGAVAALPGPVIALGGISDGTAQAAMQAGAAGVALMGSVMSCRDPGYILDPVLWHVEQSISGAAGAVVDAGLSSANLTPAASPSDACVTAAATSVVEDGEEIANSFFRWRQQRS